MTKREREERLQIMLSQGELEALDNFRFRFRLPSRAAAIRELLKRGLEGQQTGPANSGSQSKDFGVLQTGNGSSFSPDSE